MKQHLESFNGNSYNEVKFDLIQEEELPPVLRWIATVGIHRLVDLLLGQPHSGYVRYIQPINQRPFTPEIAHSIDPVPALRSYLYGAGCVLICSCKPVEIFFDIPTRKSR
jgi:hypothetical protein